MKRLAQAIAVDVAFCLVASWLIVCSGAATYEARRRRSGERC
jgi:hypothetical protein